MKKTFVTAILVACATLFSSCGDNFMQGLFELISGNATSTIGDNETYEYTSCIVMVSDLDTMPFTLGLAMSINVENLTSLKGPEDLSYPFLVFRVADTLQTEETYTVNNILTEEDLENFDYQWLINGRFANDHIVGVAESDSVFYIMSTGTINIAKKTDTKVEGSYAGMAYVINRNAVPMLSSEQVAFSGTFTSRATPMMSWLMLLQEQWQQEVAEN